MRIAHSRVVIEAPAAEETLVAQAIAAREQGEKSSWQEADCYADLSQCGWTQQRIAERCKTTQPRVSKYIACAEKYSVANNRPSFWEAYSEVDGKRRLTGYSSASDEWETPQELFEALDGEFHFTLDVCATKANAKCRRFFTEQDDGLAQEWSGVCWMNPPYGDAIEAYPSGGRHSVECKGDHRARDRVFVETGSLGPSWCQSGWVYTCRADFIAYCPFAAGRIFVIPPARLREHLNAWLRAHRIGVAANRNYWTYGVLVPLATVGELASYVVPLVRARGYAS